MPPRGRVLALGHDAYRAGAQIALLHVVRWLRDEEGFDMSLALLEGGELEAEYAAASPTRVLPGPIPPRRFEVLTWPARLRQRWDTRDERLVPGAVDLVYANSVATAATAADLSDALGCPAILHVHELEMSLRRTTTPDEFARSASRIQGFIAVSQAVARNLVDRHGIDEGRIHLINEAIPVTPVRPPPEHSDELRRSLGIPDDAVVVGGCGSSDWRKGPDLFVLIAAALARRSPERPVHFLWVGGDERPLNELRHDVDRLGLDGTVIFLPHRPDPIECFALFDIFLLTSREDPFPLVCLEAASLEVPIVCFADAGGMPEFVESDAGHVVPYGDVEAAADALRKLVEADELRQGLGRAASTKVAERCAIEVVGPRIARVLDAHLRASTSHEVGT